MSEQKKAGTNIVFPDCIICLTPLQSNLVTPIKCGHVFHEECFRNWRNKGNEDVCPLCKRDSSNMLKLIYDIKYYQDDSNQEPQTLNELLQRNKYLKFKNDTYEEEIKELKEYNDKCQKTVEGFKERVEENNKNMMKYKNDYLLVKALLDEEKEKNAKNEEKIEKLNKDMKSLQDFKNKFEMKSQIDEETEKIILNKDVDKMQDDFEKQFYKLLNDDDEKKGLHEYFYVLQQKILKLTQENEELNKYKKNVIAKEKYNSNSNATYTQLLQLSENKYKRNILDYMADKKHKKIDNEKNNNINDFTSNNNNKLDDIKNFKENVENKRQINAIKLKTNNNNPSFEYKKLFNNPFKNKECTFLKKK